jgi:catechol 2,3-dioxygenase-like lactoylglutathione lyase family enzyme
VKRGAFSVEVPNVVSDEHGEVRRASIATYGETLHTFIDRSGYQGAFLPGFDRRDAQTRVSDEMLLSIDHVVGNVDLGHMEEWVRFYEDVFGMERIPAPNFGHPVAWLRLGELQLHIFTVEEQPRRSYQHLGIEVDDLEAAYLKLKELELFEEGTRFRYLFELPDGAVQMYFRDPCDNLVEIDWPDVSTLDRSVFGEDLKKLSEVFPQGPENLRATLFLRLQEAARA